MQAFFPACFRSFSGAGVVEFRVRKGGSSPKIAWNVSTLISRHHRYQHRPPILGAMHIALAHQSLVRFAKLIEAKQRMVQGAAKIFERSESLIASSTSSSCPAA